MGVPRVVLVSNRLPITITESDTGLIMRRSIGGLATGLNAVATAKQLPWIGWAGLPTALTEQQRSHLKVPKNLIDVPIEGTSFEQYYNKLANGILWPIMHGFRPAQTDNKEAWSAVEKVIEQFAEAIISHLKPGDMIWIHDYHLVLLPEALRRRGISNRIGFFLHTPFPEAALFLQWPYHQRVIKGLLAADVIGFQTPHDAQHFTAAVRLAGMKPAPHTVIQAFPIGVPFDLYQKASENKIVQQALADIRGRTYGKRIVLSVSRLDYTKGLREQVEAFTLAVLKHRLDDVHYQLIVAPSREALTEYRTLYEGLADDVANANELLRREGRKSRIIFDYRGNGFEELNAWYRAADVFLVTPLVDGMNLVVKEYIAAHDHGAGGVVLSETIGAATQLRHALLVNPEDTREIAENIGLALTMPVSERAERWQALRHNVEVENVFWWADSFIGALADNTRIR